MPCRDCKKLLDIYVFITNNKSCRYNGETVMDLQELLKFVLRANNVIFSMHETLTSVIKTSCVFNSYNKTSGLSFRRCCIPYSSETM